MGENNSQKDEVDGFGPATNTVNPIISKRWFGKQIHITE